MSNFSFSKLIKNFYTLLISLIILVLGISIYISFEVRHKQSQLKIEQSNSQKIDTLVHGLKLRYDDILGNLNLSNNSAQSSAKQISTLKVQENIYSLILELLNKLNLTENDLPSKISLHKSESKTSLKQLDKLVKLLQIHNEAINEELHKKLLHPEEFKRLSSKLKSENKNRFQTPFRLNVYQLNKHLHKRQVERFQQLSNRREWNVDFIGDFNNRSITLNRFDADFIDKLDGMKDGEYKLKTKLRSGSLLTVYVERVTWSLPNSNKEKNQTVLNHKFKMRDDIDQNVLDQIEVESPMIIVACYLLSKKTFFGESAHPFFSGAELFIKQLRNYEKGVDTNHLMFHTATFPPNISEFNADSDQVYIFPRNAIVLMLDKPWLMRSLVSNFLEHKQLDNIYVEFNDNESNSTFYKLNHFNKAISFSKHQNNGNLKLHSGVSWNKGTPVHTIEKINNEKTVLTSKVINLGSKLKFRVYLWQSIDSFNSALYLDYLWLFLSLVIIFLIANIIRKNWNRLQDDMQECINLVVSDARTFRSASRNELKILAQSISQFNQQVKWRKEFTLLKRRILHVINMPRLEPNQYLEELDYACRDTADRFKFKIISHTENSPYTIQVKIGSSWQEELKTSDSILNFRFNGPLRQLEIEQLNHDLLTLVQRAEIQNHLRKSDQLEADVELSQKLQRVLDPITNQSELLPDNILIEPVLVRTNQMQFDAMDQIVTNKMISIYHIDINDRGLSSALLSTSLKSILHSLLQFKHKPSETLVEFNAMILSQDIVNLFVSCAVLQIDLEHNTLCFASAGHAGLWMNAENEYTCLHRQGIPLGIQTKPNFEDWSQALVRGDFCLFNNSIHLANQLPDQHIYNQTNDLKDITNTIMNKAKEDNLDFDYCAWFIRIL
ncbi:MAG: SpoIIE family protein phosphatase [bacterium]|nr:SpoIIE family protein phosphatase [bacterium]